MTRRRLVVLALVAAAAAVVLVIAYVLASEEPETPAPAAAGRGRYDSVGHLVEGTRSNFAPPDIVLVILDTVRGDAIASVNGKPPTMPSLAAWAERSTRFVDATSSAAWTAPSVSTILTGLLPSQHGVSGALRTPEMSSAVTTLAEMLAAIGYRTVAYTGGGWVSHRQGLGQGFSQFEESWSTEDPRKMLRRGLDALPRDKPVFLLLHTYEAHDAYGPKDPPLGEGDPKAEAEVSAAVDALKGPLDAHEGLPLEAARTHFVRFSSDPLYRVRFVRRLGVERPKDAAETYQWGQFPTDPQRASVEATMRSRYEAGLARLDSHLSPLFAMLDEKGFSESTVTIVCSDHGEAFGEHDALLHGHWLYDMLTRVLLLVRSPRMPVGVVSGSCGLADVTPTLLHACGLPIPADCKGRSLLPLARHAEAGAPVVAEEARRVLRKDGTSAGTFVEFHLASIRTEAVKVILTRDPALPTLTEQLFDLQADPAESKPLPVERLERFGPVFVERVRDERALLLRD